MAWTLSEVEHLKLNWPTLSATKLGIYFGKTRNAVVGKAHRLGLKKNPNSPNAVNARKPNGRAGVKRTKTVTLKTIAAKVDAYTETADLSEPRKKTEDLADYTHAVDWNGLSAKTCRYQINNEVSKARLYCGAKVQDNSPYCPECHERCRQPAPKRQKNPRNPYYTARKGVSL